MTSSAASPKLSSLNGFQSAKPADSGRFGELNKNVSRVMKANTYVLYYLTLTTAGDIPVF